MAENITLDHFLRAAVDLGAHGDNDTLPFDADNKFIKERQDDLANLAFEYCKELENNTPAYARSEIEALPIFSERLLVPTGASGFRITTKLSPFWNVYFNGLSVAIATKLEPLRGDNAHSYRFVEGQDGLFDRDRSWKAYRTATLADPLVNEKGAIVVQTDVSSFYEHIYHHRVENCINDLFPDGSTIAKQVDRLLTKFASGRSFGLPVGGQGSRIIAELFMNAVDQMLTDAGIIWHRYVDDYTLITSSQEEAYRALSVLSHALADYGLSLNRTKTTILSGKHYKDYVTTQLGVTDDESKLLREIDLHFDPYSDFAEDKYGKLKDTVKNLDISALLNLELEKSQPDTFLVAQIGRTLKFHSPLIAIHLCETLLHPKNLHAFRASWSTIMRGIAAVRAEQDNERIFDELDEILDKVPVHSAHLLLPEASCLHYLRTVRFKRTRHRARFVLNLYQTTSSDTLKRACIDCWRQWGDRPNFMRIRNQWGRLGPESQRMLWLAAAEFGDEGMHFRNQVRRSLPTSWQLGIERQQKPAFYKVYMDWAQNGL